MTADDIDRIAPHAPITQRLLDRVSDIDPGDCKRLLLALAHVTRDLDDLVMACDMKLLPGLRRYPAER